MQLSVEMIIVIICIIIINSESYNDYSNNVNNLIKEHKPGRLIAVMLRRDIYKYKNKEINTIESIARLRTYSIFIDDNFQKEQFFELTKKIIQFLINKIKK